MWFGLQNIEARLLAYAKVKDELRRIFELICKWKHWEIIQLNIQDDHIHLCILTAPRYSVSYIMQILKGKSLAWLKKKIKRAHGLYEKKSLWVKGIFRFHHWHRRVDYPALCEAPISPQPSESAITLRSADTKPEKLTIAALPAISRQKQSRRTLVRRSFTLTLVLTIV